MAHHHKLRAEAGRRTAEVGKPNKPARAAADIEAYPISTILTSPIDVTDREIEIIELYLGHEIDRLLLLAPRPKARGPPD